MSQGCWHRGLRPVVKGHRHSKVSKAGLLIWMKYERRLPCSLIPGSANRSKEPRSSAPSAIPDADCREIVLLAGSLVFRSLQRCSRHGSLGSMKGSFLYVARYSYSRRFAHRLALKSTCSLYVLTLFVVAIVKASAALGADVATAGWLTCACT